MVFTDLVGSTELRTQLGDDAADELRRAHDEALRRAVERHGGTVVKGLGDGLMATFARATDAAAVAEAVQQAITLLSNRVEADLSVRVGVSVGEVTFEDGDCFGEPVVEASRLCDVADGGQVLCSDLVGRLTRDGEHDFVAVGDLELKGLPAPVPTFELRWAPTEANEVPLPSVLTVRRPFPFVGRAEERDQLLNAFKEASVGDRVSVFVSGEPGVGKTRLVTEVAAQLHDEGAMVLMGRCDEDLGVPYQPFVEVLRHFVNHWPDGDLAPHLGRFGGDLARLIPDLPERAGELPPRLRSDEESERLRLFEAVAAWLAAISAEHPVFLVLDDLHWAAKPTLLMLRHLLRSPEEMAALVVGTYRDTDLDRTHPLAEMLADLRRGGEVTRVALRGLDAAEVRAFLESAAGHALDQPGEALADALHAETEGNAFFLEEVILHLTEAGTIYQDGEGRWTSDLTSIDDFGIPEGIREVVGRRLSRLSEEANDVLGKAAVLGPEFEVSVLAEMAGGSDLLGPLEEAERTGLLIDAGSESPAYAFTHALVRQTLTEELSTARRQQYHLAAADALEARGANPSAVVVHLRHAGVAAEPERVVNATLAAAESARSQHAWEEATGHWEAALDLLEVRGGEPEQHARLLERLGEAMYFTAVDWEHGLDQLERARAMYEELDDTYSAAKVDSKIGQMLASFPNRIDLPRAYRHLEAAEAALGERGDSVPLGFTLIGLAQAHMMAGRRREGEGVSRRALEVGERLGHEGVQGNARVFLGAHLSRLGQVDDGLEHMRKGYEQAVRIGEVFTAWLGATYGSVTLHFLYDPRAAEAWVDEELTSGRLDEAPQLDGFLRSSKVNALWAQGRIAEAGVLAESTPYADMWLGEVAFPEGDWETALSVFSQLTDEFAQQADVFNEAWGRHQAARTRRVMGEPEQAIEGLEELLRDLPGSHRDRLVDVEIDLALFLAEVGRIDDALEHATAVRARLAPDQDYRGLEGRVTLAEAVTAVDDTESDQLFAEAVEIFRRYHTAVLEVEAFEEWGRRTGRSEHFDAAGALYEQMGFGHPWLDRLERIRRSATP